MVLAMAFRATRDIWERRAAPLTFTILPRGHKHIMKTKTIIVSVVTLYLSIMGAHMNANSTEKKLPGAQAKAIQIACQEFEKKLKVSWMDYLVSVEESEREFVVNFTARLATAELRGSPSGVPGFQIKIRRSDYSVESSQFNR